MVGDDDVGLRARSLGPFDETATIMRAACIDAFAAPVRQRRRSGAAKEAGKPARQVAADHVAVLGISSPTTDQLREYGRPAGKCALQCVFEVQKAEVIFAALANDDLPRPLLGIGKQ